jgi:hypothetical protein
LGENISSRAREIPRFWWRVCKHARRRRRDGDGDGDADARPTRATAIARLTRARDLDRTRRAVVSSVRVPEMGAREVRGAMAVAVLGEAGGGDVQILRV